MYRLENNPPQVDSVLWACGLASNLCLCVHHKSLPFLLAEEPWVRVCDLARGMV